MSIDLSTRRVAKNTVSQVVAFGLSVGTKAVAAVAVARLHGPEGLGAYALAWSLAGTVGFAALLGLDSRLIREMSRSRSVDEANRTLPLAALLSSVAAAVVAIAPAALGAAPDVSSALAASAVFIALSGPVLVFRATFHARERMELEVAAIAAEGAAGLLLVVGSLLAGGGVTQTILALGAARVVNLAVSAVLYERVWGGIKPIIDPRRWLRLLSSSVPMGVMYALTGVVFRVDLIVLTALRPASEVGLYGAASVLVLGMPVVAAALTGSLYPVLSRAGHRHDPELVRVFAATWHLLLLVGIAIAVTLTVAARPVVALLYGNGFADTALVLSVLAWTVPLRFVNSLGGFTLAATDTSGRRLLVVGSSFAFHVAATVAGVALFGAAGAVGALLATEVVIAAVLLPCLHPLRPTLRRRRLHHASGRAVVTADAFTAAGVTFAVGGGDRFLTEAMLRRFEHLRTDDDPQIVIEVVDAVERPAGASRAGVGAAGIPVVLDDLGRACTLPVHVPACQDVVVLVEAGFSETAFASRVLLPLVRRRLLAQGAVLVHGSAVSSAGAGVLLAGESGCGKTAAMLRLLRAGAGPVANDWVILSKEGMLHPFNLQLTVRRRDAAWEGQVIPMRDVRRHDVLPEAGGPAAPNGDHANGHHNGHQSNGHHANGHHSNGHHSNGHHGHGQHQSGQHSNGHQANGHHAGRASLGLHPNGDRSAEILYRGSLAVMFPDRVPASAALHTLWLFAAGSSPSALDNPASALVAGLRERSRPVILDAVLVAAAAGTRPWTEELLAAEEVTIRRAIAGARVVDALCPASPPELHVGSRLSPATALNEEDVR